MKLYLLALRANKYMFTLRVRGKDASTLLPIIFEIQRKLTSRWISNIMDFSIVFSICT